MHPNPAFRRQTRETNLAFARDRAFGTLAINGPDGPLVSHVPFLISADGTTLDTHLARSTALARVLPAPAVMAIEGPQGYVSPDWYGLEDQVPTWNYVAVHLRGPLEPLPPEALHDMLDRQSALFEHRLAPKRPWTSDKMTPGVMDRMMRAIIPCRMRIEGVEGTWKLGQNKPDAARIGAADGLGTAGLAPEAQALAALMRDPPAS